MQGQQEAEKAAQSTHYVAKVGVGVDPQTKDIDRYELENLIIWDTPGFGDSEAADKEYSRQIASKLEETDEDGKKLIDIVLVVLDASSKDMGTSYKLISKTILPHLDTQKGQRILIAINQAKRKDTHVRFLQIGI